MSWNTDLIKALLNGEDIETWGLHFIATPDTQELMESVRDKVQKMLDRIHESNNVQHRKRTISTQILPIYDQFANGESIATIENSVRGKHVYLFSDPHGSWQPEKKDELRSLNDKYMHDKLVAGALKENGASSVNIVLQTIPYARQDKSTPNKRQAASLDIIWWELAKITWENGYIITTDLHNPASKSSFQWTHFINLYSWWFVKRVIEEAKKEDKDFEPILLPADQWWYTKISRIAQEYSIKNLLATKTRNYSKNNTVDDIGIIGDIEWTDIIIHDDILDTGWTLVKLLEEVLKRKPKSIRVAITHGLFNKEAFQKLSSLIINSSGIIKWVYITDTVNKNLWENNWVKKISTQDIISNTIFSIFQRLPVNRWNDTDYTK